MSISSDTRRVVIFGEVLFDVFPDGHSVLGGAPFNVAWNLQGLGLPPLVVSRVGTDEQGDRVLDSMREWGMETAGIQRDDSHPTGSVVVSLRDGQPEYDIVKDQAYDFIDADRALDGIRGADGAVLYHGTLGARSPVSGETLCALRDALPESRFVDVNLRAPWWSLDSVLGMMEGAAWVKLNEGELAEIAPDASASGEDGEAAARELRTRMGFRFLVVTHGARGAHLVQDDGTILTERPVPLEEIQDTVGAGDAFSAVMILGLSRNWPVDVTLRRAVEFAASRCSMRGATSSDRGLYTPWAEKWDGEDG